MTTLPTAADVTTATSPEVAPAERPARRLASLDVARGLVVIASVVLTTLSGPYAQRHAPWYGLAPIDLLFPSFVTLTGAALALSLRRPLRPGRVARRTLVLIAAGLAFNLVVQQSWDLQTLRYPGVLQLIAVVGVVVVVVARLLRSWWWAPLLVAAAVLVGYTVLLLQTSGSCPQGLPQPHCNLPGRLDEAVFGIGHTYGAGVHGFDPEGLLPTLGAVASGLIGLVAGLLVTRLRPRLVVPALLGLAASSAAASVVLAGWVPVAKRLWTPAFACRASAVAVLLLAVCYLVADLGGGRASRPARLLRGVLWPVVAFGRNSLLVYFGKHLVALGLAAATVAGSGLTLADDLHRRLAGTGALEPFAYAGVMLAAWVVVTAVLHSRRWYLRA
jgi:heparan-alpha-glucosaminide N-acetyltransferase